MHYRLFLPILFLFIVGNLCAQPLAPITWQTTRSLRATTSPYLLGQVYSHGDTLFATGSYQPAGRSFDIGTVSNNLGQTWSVWHYFPDTLHDTYSATGTVFLSNGIHDCDAIAGGGYGFYGTTNLGTTWSPPSITGWIAPLAQVGDTVFCIGSSGTSIFYTTNCSTIDSSWSIPSPFQGSKLGYSRETIHLVQRTTSDRPGYPRGHVYYTRGNSWGGIWEPVLQLDSFAVNGSQEVNIDFDEVGNGCLLLRTNNALFGNDYVFIRSTQDNGVTWIPAQQVSPGATASIFDGYITHFQHLWVAAWIDATVSPGFTGVGTRISFSANRGRSWYPSQQISASQNDSNIAHVSLSAVEIRGSRIRVFDNRYPYIGQDSTRICLTEGIIRPDSISPVLTQAITIPNSVSPDSTVTLSIHAHDNDSLWMMGAVLHNVSTGDSIYLPLTRGAGESYSGQWHTPTQTGQWIYYYRAEDMWENVSTYPTNANQNPLVVWVGPVSVSDTRVLPEDYSFSIYPNPANAGVTFRISEMYLHQKTSLAVYDVVGRKVTQWNLNGSFDRTIYWDSKDREGHKAESGLYFAVISSPTHTERLKFVLLK